MTVRRRRHLLEGLTQRALAVLLTVLVFGGFSAALAATTPVYTYKVVRTYPHDPTAFTEGLFYKDGYLYESTGLEGQSSIRKERLETSQVIQRIAIPDQYFGEGVVAWKGKLIELTWRSHIGFIYDLATLQKIAEFRYPGEGWALTKDDHRLIMSDGTPDIRFLDPLTLKQIGTLHVTDQGRPVENLNELEWVKGQIYANIWQTDRIARIDPHTGHVLGWIDLTGLLSPADRVAGETDVLNGIAYDPKGDRLFVTGKNWPKLFEIKLVRK